MADASSQPQEAEATLSPHLTAHVRMEEGCGHWHTEGGGAQDRPPHKWH